MGQHLVDKCGLIGFAGVLAGISTTSSKPSSFCKISAMKVILIINECLTVNEGQLAYKTPKT